MRDRTNFTRERDLTEPDAALWQRFVGQRADQSRRHGEVGRRIGQAIAARHVKIDFR